MMGGDAIRDALVELAVVPASRSSRQSRNPFQVHHPCEGKDRS